MCEAVQAAAGSLEIDEEGLAQNSFESPEVDTILFDLDGTLIDTYQTILRSMRYTMKTVLGKEYSDEQLMGKVGQPLKTQMEDYARSEAECVELQRVYREYQSTIHDGLTQPFDGCEEALSWLKDAGYKMGVVTSKLHEPALRGLQLFGLDGYFSCLVGADDCTLHKPNPAPVLYGAELLGSHIQTCIYIGDSPFDIQAGNAAQACTVAALWGMFSKEILLAQVPDYVCSNISEFARWMS